MSEPTGLRGDPLDRSVAEWEAAISRALDWVPHTDEQETERTAGLLALSALTVYADALVEVARAARSLTEKRGIKVGEWEAVVAALDRLDKDTA